ncbi:AC2 protein [Papaya leaf crumple virus-Panipat 8 [India:Panipat:Papaya:2008]]|uniref:Transcriptional activator protein n=1 Tax=Papaya leaf crumple virus-Panipat 8 [India:Panipat:Papaya:2008] TaxID=913600 RepID=E5F1L2_9GEMI|nr:AC2 protein [Papaya leaf crumple virus-Panipat 8 [India:Panipat:Papaya:2008]]ADQ13208.1 AC2 protein [Papaya leaf crumple virus-Panipat 8 [India:Panipat:Papaya:2008]]
MQHSSPSQSHCTQVPIKVQHRLAKRRAFRRKRVDLECGCSYYVHINCHNHGFTHRGIHHCRSCNEWRVYLGNPKSPLFQDNRTPQQAVPNEGRHHLRSDTIQSQPQEETGDNELFLGLEDPHSFTSSDLAFLKSL